MKRILITGSNGFIGKNLVEYYSHDYQVFAPKRQEVDLTNFLMVKEYLAEYSFDVVIHSATHNATITSSYNRNLVLNNNLRMFYNLEACSDLYGKMIYFGSGAEFSREHYIPYMNESYFGKNIPADDYGFSKYLMNKTAEASSNIYNLRLFGVYGKYEDWKIRFISNNICRALLEKEYLLYQHVNFDYLYIDDLCEIVNWFIMNEPMYKSYNVCTGKSLDLYDIAKKIKFIMNKNLPIIVQSKGWKKEYSGDNSRLINELGKYNFIDMDVAIEKLVRWYENHRDILKDV